MGIVESLAFFPPAGLVGRQELRFAMERDGEMVKDFWLTTGAGVRVPALHFERGSPKQTILFCHGNAVDVGIIFRWLRRLSDVTNSRVIAVEYPGYMDSYKKSSIASASEESQLHSAATPSESGCFAAGLAGLQYLVEEVKVPQTEIVFMGRSLGTGPTMEISYKQENCKATVLLSPLISANRTKFPFLAYTPAAFDDIFDSSWKAPRISSPTLIVHGDKDKVVPW